MNRFAVGLDLGQAADYSAIAVVQRVPQEPAQYHARRVERLALQTPYPQVVDHVRRLLGKPELAGAELVVDAMGVGMPAVDMLREAGLRPIPVKVHGGASVSRDEAGAWHIPKRDLVTALRVLLENEQLKIASGTAHAEALVHELLSYRVKFSQAGHDSYEAWREGDHDDLLFALGLACWWMERGGTGYAYAGGGVSRPVEPSPVPNGGFVDRHAERNARRW